MNSVPASRAEEFLSLAGPGFRDFTRIAASDPQVWRDVLIANREELAAGATSSRRWRSSSS
jgi:prephenate dehydrogenase